MRVHVIETGRVQIKASQIVGRGMGSRVELRRSSTPSGSEWLPVNAYAIEHRDGVILVYTGVSAGAKRLPALASRFPLVRPLQHRAGAGGRPAVPERRCRRRPEAAIKRVVLTHLHIDHDGGLGAFPSSAVRNPRQPWRTCARRRRCWAASRRSRREAGRRSFRTEVFILDAKSLWNYFCDRSA